MKEQEQKRGEIDSDEEMAGLWELFDVLPPILTLDVATASSMVTSVSVLKSWKQEGVLQIELTQPNSDLLHEDPGEDPAGSTPSVEKGVKSMKPHTVSYTHLTLPTKRIV